MRTRHSNYQSPPLPRRQLDISPASPVHNGPILIRLRVPLHLSEYRRLPSLPPPLVRRDLNKKDGILTNPYRIHPLHPLHPASNICVTNISAFPVPHHLLLLIHFLHGSLKRVQRFRLSILCNFEEPLLCFASRQTDDSFLANYAKFQNGKEKWISTLWLPRCNESIMWSHLKRAALHFLGTNLSYSITKNW